MMAQWVTRYSGGSITDEKQANYVLIGFAVVGILISVILFFISGPKGQEPTSASIQQVQQFMTQSPH